MYNNYYKFFFCFFYSYRDKNRSNSDQFYFLHIYVIYFFSHTIYVFFFSYYSFMLKIENVSSIDHFFYFIFFYTDILNNIIA